MVEASNIRAVLFAKDLERMATFYSVALGMKRGTSDEHHVVLQRSDFELIVHQIPNHIAHGIEIADPPARREAGSLRLDYPVESIESSRSLAKSFGGGIDEVPPPWAERGTNFYLGYDPEGNVFGVSQQAT
jgi:predicted enzyme related to lactoylglutathione lyase